MPEIRHANHDSVNVFAGNKLFVVAVAGNLCAIVVFFLDKRLCILHADRIKICDRDNSRDVLALKYARDLKRRGDAPQTDDAYVDLVVGGKPANRTAKDERCRTGGKHACKKSPTI